MKLEEDGKRREPSENEHKHKSPSIFMAMHVNVHKPDHSQVILNSLAFCAHKTLLFQFMDHKTISIRLLLASTISTVRKAAKAKQKE